MSITGCMRPSNLRKTFNTLALILRFLKEGEIKLRKQRFAVLGVILAIVTSAPLGAEERYQCVPDQAAGFSFDLSAQRWKSMNLRAEGEKYIIREATPSESALAIVSAGANYEECRSTNGFENSGKAYFECIFGEFIFNKNTGRFLRTYTAGYIDGLDNNENTPAILIGRCSQF